MAPSRSSLVLAGACACIAACKRHEPPPPAPAPAGPPPADTIPRVAIAFSLDGELHEAPWNERSLRGVFVDGGEQARPYSEIRLLHDATNLYVGLYAADENIVSTDAWELAVGPRHVRFDAAGHSDAPDVPAGVDRDGTLDAPDDFDEEWVIEAAIPLATLGPPPLAITAKRCDTLKNGERRCGTWQRTLALE